MVPGLRVESVTVAYGPYELRVHRVTGAPAGTRVTHTGWATGPDDPLVSALYGLHGWGTGPDTLRAPRGTACTRWAEVPRLAGEAGGTSVHVCLAALTAEPGPGPLADAVTEVAAGDTEVLVGWADGGARTRIRFDPVRVTHGRELEGA
jgi:hypothetical protein